MSQRESLEVRMDDRLVGTLALTANHKVAFSYSEEWLEHGFSVSPFSLPLKNEVFVPKKDYFDGLFGVFADSLPDAWGQLLLERLLKERGKKEAQCNLLEYLTQRDIQTKNSGVNVRYRGKHRFFKGFNEFIKEKTRRCDNDFEKIERHVFF